MIDQQTDAGNFPARVEISSGHTAQINFGIHQILGGFHHSPGGFHREPAGIGIHLQNHIAGLIALKFLHHAARFNPLARIRAAEKSRRRHGPRRWQRRCSQHLNGFGQDVGGKAGRMTNALNLNLISHLHRRQVGISQPDAGAAGQSRIYRQSAGFVLHNKPVRSAEPGDHSTDFDRQFFLRLIQRKFADGSNFLQRHRLRLQRQANRQQQAKQPDGTTNAVHGISVTDLNPGLKVWNNPRE